MNPDVAASILCPHLLLPKSVRNVKSTTDILIIGGGVCGLTTAWFLAQDGASVTVVDRRRVGREASWAGAGMLPPGVQSPTNSPEARLRSYSHSLWPQLSAELRDRTGIDNGYRKCGAVELSGTQGFDDAVSAWQAEGIHVVACDRRQLEQHVPDLAPEFESGVYLPDFGQARNPRHLKALVAGCQSLGVEIIENVGQLRLLDQNGLVTAASSTRQFHASRVCVTAGAWTNELLAQLQLEVPVFPVRGQLAQLRMSPLPFSCVIEQGRRYLVPRPDGLILVGSTEEHTGFVKQTTADGISGLLKFAQCLVPELRNAELVRSWAGLRPGSPDELPLLGRTSLFDNLFVGAGHFRSGLQMSPGSGKILADLLLDRPAPIDMDGLDLNRVLQGGSPLSH
jgi:glycine oxidase